MAVARGRSLSWFYDVILDKGRPVARTTRRHVEELRHVSRAGHPTIVFIWFSQTTVVGGDWSVDQYIKYMAKVARAPTVHITLYQQCSNACCVYGYEE